MDTTSKGKGPLEKSVWILIIINQLKKKKLPIENSNNSIHHDYDHAWTERRVEGIKWRMGLNIGIAIGIEVGIET